jgi:hypothetical protein
MYDEKTPTTEQGCYDLGYSNPARSHKDFKWVHVVDLNAYHCGQMDRQNHAPRNSDYRREEYDPVTGERNPAPIIYSQNDENSASNLVTGAGQEAGKP